LTGGTGFGKEPDDENEKKQESEKERVVPAAMIRIAVNTTAGSLLS
jgi:hypothetical protein